MFKIEKNVSQWQTTMPDMIYFESMIEIYCIIITVIDNMVAR